MNHHMPGLPVHHQLPEFTQTHAHRVSDAIQPSHPLLSPSPPAPNPSQHQGLFQWVNSSHEVAKVLEFHLQHQSFQWTPRTYLLQDGLVGSPCSPRDSQESSPTPQLKSINFSAFSFLYSPTLTSIHDHWKNHSLLKLDSMVTQFCEYNQNNWVLHFKRVNYLIKLLKKNFQLFLNYTTHEHTHILKLSSASCKPSEFQSLPKGSCSQQFGIYPSRLCSLHLHMY